MHRWIAGVLSLVLVAGCGGEQDNGEEPAEEEQAAEQAESWEVFERDYPGFATAYERQQIMLLGTTAQLEAAAEVDTTYALTTSACGKALPADQWLVAERLRAICDAEIDPVLPAVNAKDCYEEFLRCIGSGLDAPCSSAFSDCLAEGS